MLKLLSLFTGGIYGYLIAGGLAACLSGGATYYIVHNAGQLEITRIKLADANQKAADVSGSLKQLQGFISGMQAAETDYSHTLNRINSNIAGLKGQWANATAKPLPLDCVPDIERVRSVNAAIHAANSVNPTPSP